MLGLGEKDLVVDIGSNDGTLLSNFQKAGHRVLGIEPTDVGDIANQRGIPTLKRYFGIDVAREVKDETRGRRASSRRRIASRISRMCTPSSTASSKCSAPDGVFISESHYLIPAARHTAIRHRLSRASALLFAGEPEAPPGDARSRSVPRPPDPEPWRLDPRLCRTPRRQHRARQRAPHAGGGTARQSDERSAWPPSNAT